MVSIPFARASSLFIRGRRAAVLLAAWLLVGGTPLAAHAQEANTANSAEAEAAPTGVLTKPPALLNFVKAPYPPAAEEARLEANVELLLTIGVDGKVTAAEVSKAAGHGFDEAAVAAARQFLFQPAEIDGVPAAVQIQFRYGFTLEKKAVVVEPKPEAKPMGRLSGQLRERGTRARLAGIEVRLKGLEMAPAYTNPEGRFSFDAVPVGEVTIVVSDADYETIEDVETIGENEETEVIYYLGREGFGDTVTVVARRPKKEVTRRTVEIKEIRLIPGTNGDALRVVQNLPGVARTPFGRTELIFRGGGNSAAYLNQQLIPLPFHFGGIRSTVASALIESIEVYPGNFSAEFGRVNGGVVDITLRSPRVDGWHGYAEADLFDAGALVEGPVGEHSGIAMAFRRSYVDAILVNVIPEDSDFQLSTAPRYFDGQVLWETKIGQHRLRALAYGSSDEFVAVLEEPPDTSPLIRGRSRLGLKWAGGQLEWRWRPTEDLTHTANVAWVSSKVDVEFGGNVDLDFLFHQLLFRERLDWQLGEDTVLRIGQDVDARESNIKALGKGSRRREGDTGGALGDGEEVYAESTQYDCSPALWTDLETRLGPVTLIPGARLDLFEQTDEWLFQPRFTARWALSEKNDLKAGAGLYVQPPEADETTEPQGNPAVNAITSIHTTLGYEHRLTALLKVDLNVFYKSFDNLVRRNPDPEIRFDNEATGRAYGAEILLEHAPSKRFFGWLAYTLQRSERRDGPGEPWRLFDVDQTHNLIGVGTYRLTPEWSIGARWRYVTGTPRTPVIGAVYGADIDQYYPLYGELNSARNTDFHQLDLRMDWDFVYTLWRLTVYVDVRNVYNRANASNLRYSYDFSQSEQGFEIPIFPSFGVRGEF